MLTLRTFVLAGYLVIVPFASAQTSQLIPPTPIPTHGAVPGMVSPTLLRAVQDMVRAAEFGPYQRQLRSLARRHFGFRRDTAIRQRGLDSLRDFTDTGALFALPFAFDNEKNDVRKAMFDHLEESGPIGQAALAWTAIHHKDKAMRTEATSRVTLPHAPLVLAVIESGLRDTRHAVVSASGSLAGAIGAAQAIPLLIFTQYSEDRVEKKGDLAWIAIGTQQSYVQNLIPVTGNGAGSFRPVIGTITEGFVMRVSDAVAIVYRSEVHVALERLSTTATGQSTASLGWDLNRWRAWYNDTYLPMLAGRVERAEQDRKADAIVEREAARN